MKRSIIPFVVMFLSAFAFAGELKLSITDAKTGEPAYCHVRLSQGETEITPTGCIETLAPEEQLKAYATTRQPYMRMYYVKGECSFPKVSGEVTLLVERGLETLPIQQTLTIGEDETKTLELKLERFANLNADGWYSGDMHTHLMFPDDETKMAAQLAGQRCEDLNLCGGMSIYYIEQLKNERASAKIGEEGIVREGNFIAFTGEEYRHPELGHMLTLATDDWILNEQHYAPLHTDAAFETFNQGGFAGFCHGGAAATGKCVMYLNDAMGMNQWVEVIQFRKFNEASWYQALNMNICTPPIGATDMPVGNGIIGGDRTYAYVEGELTLRKWLQAIADGKCFATSGPLLGLTINDKKMWQDVHLPAAGGEVEIDAWSESRYPPETLELVKNGEVIETIKFDGQRSATLKTTLKVDASCWLAVRVSGTTPTGHPQNAHSNAMYVYVDNKPIAVDPGWRGANWRLGNLKGQWKFYETEAPLDNAEYWRAYYSPIYADGMDYYRRARRVEEGKDTPPTLLVVYPTKRFPTLSPDETAIAFSVTGHVVSEGGSGLSVQVDDGEPVTYHGRSPYRMPKLTPGEHTITLRLIDSAGKPLSNPQASVTRAITFAAAE